MNICLCEIFIFSPYEILKFLMKPCLNLEAVLVFSKLSEHLCEPLMLKLIFEF